jgi:hypothetical protein
LSTPRLKPRNLDREAAGLIETPDGPAFLLNMNLSIPFRKMLADIPNESVVKIIRECEAELGRRSEKYR